MRAEKAIHSLLTAASGVTALVGTRIYPPPLPQNVALPAIAVEHISTVDVATIDANAGYNLVRSRIEVTVLAKDYATQKALIEAVRLALTYQRGTFAGVNVASILRDSVGPDLRDDDMQVFSQSIDFIVTLSES
jgi:Flp pilus assembly protein CpaB